MQIKFGGCVEIAQIGYVVFPPGDLGENRGRFFEDWDGPSGENWMTFSARLHQQRFKEAYCVLFPMPGEW